MGTSTNPVEGHSIAVVAKSALNREQRIKKLLAKQNQLLSKIYKQEKWNELCIATDEITGHKELKKAKSCTGLEIWG